MNMEQIRGALKNLLERYVNLVNSGDAGNWNPEEEPEVIGARAALRAQITGAKINIQGHLFSAQEIFDMYTEASSARYEAQAQLAEERAKSEGMREAILEAIAELDQRTGELCPLCSEERPKHQHNCPHAILDRALGAQLEGEGGR